MGSPLDANGLPGLPPKRKVKAYKVLGDVGEFQERLATTLPPAKAPEPDNVFTVSSSEFPPDVWFAATISPDNGVAVISSYRELCKARSLYQQQLTNIHTARRQHGMPTTMLNPGASSSFGGFYPGTQPPLPNPGEGPMHLTITERVQLGAETRRLDRFGAQQAVWDGVTAGLATRVGRPPVELAMQRGPAWRTREEITELLHRAAPRDVHGAHPDAVWTMSLRDAWERIIPVGSIFSGIYVKVKEKHGEMPEPRAIRVGRPLDPLGVTAGTSLNALATGTHRQQMQQQHGTAGSLTGKAPLGRALSARGRAWEDSEVIQKRVAEYGSRLRSLAPHDPDFGSLAVAGEALEGQLAALANAPISLGEVESHVREHDSAAYEGYMAVKSEMEAQLRAALEAEEAARHAAEEAARATAPQPGPHVEASTPHLSFGCHAGETASASVTLTSRGTAAVWWNWERRPGAQHPHASLETSQPPRFIASQQSGTLLPGQSLEVAVTFVPGAAAGTFRETWHLITTPPLQGASPHLTLELRGAAETRDTSAGNRAALEASLAEREKLAVVAAALERVLRDVKAPRRPQPPEPAEEAAAADAWDRANGSPDGPHAWPPLFHSPGTQSELSELYREALAALQAALAPPPEEDTKKKKKDTKKAAEEAPLPPPKFPSAWDGRLATLDAVLADLAAAPPPPGASSPPPQHAPLAARLAAAQARARVAPSSRRILRRAMRSLVHKLADAVEDKFNVIRTDLEAKAAAERAAERAAEGGDGDGGEGEGGEKAAEGEQGGKAEKASPAKAPKPAPVPKGAKAGKAGKGAAGAAESGESGVVAAAPGAGLPSVEHLQPAFHDKAMTVTRAVVKSQLNGLQDEVTRHKVAIGEALEGQIRRLDAAVAAEQQRLAAGSGAAGSPASELRVELGRVAAAGGVPGPGPGAAAGERSPVLESLYWERMQLLRTWTGLGVPNRGDIR